MIQCKDCELYRQEPDGRRIFMCDPFMNIKEPECLAKWQLLRLDVIASAQNNMAAAQAQMAPLQSKILKYIKRELEDIDESEKWRIDEESEPEAPPTDQNDQSNYLDFDEGLGDKP
jgi:hypothetical protein